MVGSFFVWRGRQVVLCFEASDEVFGFNSCRRKVIQVLIRDMILLTFFKTSLHSNGGGMTPGRLQWKQLHCKALDTIECWVKKMAINMEQIF